MTNVQDDSYEAWRAKEFPSFRSTDETGPRERFRKRMWNAAWTAGHRHTTTSEVARLRSALHKAEADRAALQRGFVRLVVAIGPEKAKDPIVDVAVAELKRLRARVAELETDEVRQPTVIDDAPCERPRSPYDEQQTDGRVLCTDCGRPFDVHREETVMELWRRVDDAADLWTKARLVRTPNGDGVMVGEVGFMPLEVTAPTQRAALEMMMAKLRARPRTRDRVNRSRRSE